MRGSVRVSVVIWSLRECLLRQKLTATQVGGVPQKAAGRVESPAQPVENALGVATGGLPIRRRLPTCPTKSSRRAKKVGFHSIWRRRPMRTARIGREANGFVV